MGNRSKLSATNNRCRPATLETAASPGSSVDNAEPQAKRKRLLARWTGNLMRTFGGSASAADRLVRPADTVSGKQTEVTLAPPSEPTSAHSTLAKRAAKHKQHQRSPLRFCRWPVSSSDTNTDSKRPRTWFLKSLSSSTSTLKAQSSGWADELTSSAPMFESRHQAAPSSPYRHIAAVLARVRRPSSSYRGEQSTTNKHLLAPANEHSFVSPTQILGRQQAASDGRRTNQEQRQQPGEQAHDKQARLSASSVAASNEEIRLDEAAPAQLASSITGASVSQVKSGLSKVGLADELEQSCRRDIVDCLEANGARCVRTSEREAAQLSCLGGQEVKPTDSMAQKGPQQHQLQQQARQPASSPRKLQIRVDESDCEHYANKPTSKQNASKLEVPSEPDSSATAGEQAGQADSSRLLSLIQPLASASSLSGSSESICSSVPSSSMALSSSQALAISESNPTCTGERREEPDRPVSQPAGAHNLFADQSSSPGRVSVHRSRLSQAPSSGVGMLKSNLKRLVKRQQSVDSYRMARDLKNKLKRQQDQTAPGSRAHQSSEAIEGDAGASSHASQVSGGRKLSLLIGIQRPLTELGSLRVPEPAPDCQIRVSAPKKVTQVEGTKDKCETPTPPSTLSLMAVGQHQQGSFVVGSFSGCITPTYPTHHLPSPKYVSAAMLQAQAKKYSNASTISSTLGAGQDCQSQSALRAASVSSQSKVGTSILSGNGAAAAATGPNQSDTESSLGGSVTPSRASRFIGVGGAHSPALTGTAYERSQSIVSAAFSLSMSTGVPAQPTLSAAEEAARRVQLAEHIYDNKCGLGEDMKFLASFPELCDITFLVGETREPVCAVKSVLAARSRVFNKILFGNRMRRVGRQQNHYNQSQAAQVEEQAARNVDPAVVELVEGQTGRTGSSSPKRALASKSSSPIPPIKSSSPNQPQWSVTLDAGGFSSGPPADLTDSYQVSLVASKSGGRVSSLASGGRGESVASLTSSMGSQQPLIIGPGQTAAPAKRNKKAASRMATSSGLPESSGASRLRSMFTKRASDPSIKQRQSSDSIQANLAGSAQNYLDKMSSSQMSTTMIIEEFEPDVFRQLIEYMHTGCVLLQARTLLGLLNAADYYGLEQLRRACLRFVSCCITVDTVCSLLSTAERYIQYKCTKSIVQKVLEFVDTHADEIFKLNAFGLLPEHVVHLILARDGLQADEQVKYSGVYTWCEHYCRSNELTNIADVMRNFLDLIQFHKIPRDVLLSQIYPTRIVPDHIFLSALAYQADPDKFEPAQPARARRMTLPNPIVYKGAQEDVEARSARNPRQTAADKRGWRKQSELSATGDIELQQSRQQTRANVSHRSRALAGSQFTSDQARQARHVKLRKGSIAQVSISSVVRLSHKLSIKKRHSNLIDGGSSAESRRRRSSAATSIGSLFGSHARVQSRPNLCNKTAPNGAEPEQDPLQVGQQILNDYLERQRQREADESRDRAEALQDSQAQQQQAALDNDRKSSATLAACELGRTGPDLQAHERQQLAKSSSSTSRKSFRDFKHISRRLFMRHSSSKLVQSSVTDLGSAVSATPTASTADTANSAVATKPISGASLVQTASLTFGVNNQPISSSALSSNAGEILREKRRNLFRIKRINTINNVLDTR